MRIILGADHGGYEMKEEVKRWLMKRRERVEDKGAVTHEAGDDFVEYAEAVVREIVQDKKARGVVFCRNGVGVSIVANRFAGVRCALGFEAEQVRRARTDDDINCLAIAADYVGERAVKEMVEVFLTTGFGGEERFVRRLDKLEQVGN